MNHPFFSVIIPTYNRKYYLKIAMESVFAQDFKDYELIVVDDGSTDGTGAFMRENFRDKPFLYAAQENKGPAAARNHGLRQARGEWIAFLDSDDRFVHFKLSRVCEYIRLFPDCRVFHTEELWYRDGVYLEQKGMHRKPDGFCFEEAVRLCCVSISTAVIHTSVFTETGAFDENFLSCEDYDFWLRALLKFPVKLIPEYLTIKDGGRADQQSQKFFGMDRFRVKALLKIIPCLKGRLREKAVKELIAKSTVYYQGALKRGKEEEAEYYREIIEKVESSE